MVGTFSVIFVFPLERAIIARERASGTYRVSAYYGAKVLAEAPRSLVFNSAFGTILYWAVGLRASASAFFFFLLALWTTTMTAEALALSIAIAAPNPTVAIALSPPAVVLSLLFGGFFIPGARIGPWIGWLRWVSSVHYAFAALSENQFPGGRPAGAAAAAAAAGRSARVNSLGRWGNLAALAGLMVVFRLLGYVALRTVRRPRFNRSL
ncbi:hypothetical protein BU14_3034s0001 [Porphyra umbilicalis]|uniref:ABC-2 type transporter transmembrane domain-containing protein n=1 Tax=Porphyra umbilicalis TaxID=2786 RepID=A0A1X6NI60_PORUM|nr:hypothetical protein BU14_3034s0001 [Porphyra umbilicalis]|eukprot:OSX68311.1 hypothetical protein BU14_3034s0001 [Porphyra umbilicalis]